MIVSRGSPAEPATPSAAGLVEGAEPRHSLAGQLEIEDPQVLLDPVSVGRLGYHQDALLHGPAEQHLRGGSPAVRGDSADEPR